MKKRVISLLLFLCLTLTLLPSYAMAASSTKTLDCGTFKLEITNVYAIDSMTTTGGDGITTIYFVVVPNGATVKSTKVPKNGLSYNLHPFNDIKFSNKSPMYPTVEFACDYDDSIYVEAKEGSIVNVVKNNEYYYSDGENGRNYGVRIFVVDDETLVQFGGPKPASKPQYTSNTTASPSNSQFVVRGKNGSFGEENPLVVTQAYSINQTNYLQLRAIATLLNKTAAQFDIGWDGKYAVIEPGKEFSSTVTGSKMQDTKNVRTSDTKFKMNGEVFSFKDAKLINGDINYIQLREFAQKLSGTKSQFNVYWDDIAKKVIIQPGKAYTGTKSVDPITVLEQYNGEEDILADGEYYLQISGKFLYPVPGGRYWLELRRDIPDKPYNIKLAENSKDKGPKYSLK